MRLLTEDATLVCSHQRGRLTIETSQTLVTIERRIVLVEPDPESRKIRGCPNIGATIKPCRATLAVKTGYSDLLRIDGRRICLDSVSGLTDGTPPGMVKYQVAKPGQEFVEEAP